MPKWGYYSSGSYNRVYISTDHTWVLKILKRKPSSYTDTPERSVRLWNEINAHIGYPPAKLVKIIDPDTGEKIVAWMCPFIRGRQATDEEIQKAVIDIKLRTGRVLMDATAKKNFITTKTQTICVDIAMACLLVEDNQHSLKRQKSIISLDAWARANENYTDFFRHHKKKYPNTVSTIQALLFINSYQPRMDVIFLKENTKEVKKLRLRFARGYRNLLPFQYPSKNEMAKTTNLIQESKNNLSYDIALTSQERKKEQNKSLALDNIKEDCHVFLNNYIASRGVYDEKTRVFTPSFSTFFFKDNDLIIEKVLAILSFKKILNAATTFNELKIYLTLFSLEFPNSQNKCLNSKSEFSMSVQRCLDHLHSAWEEERKELPYLKMHFRKLR